jgi:hypothetical protein
MYVLHGKWWIMLTLKATFGESKTRDDKRTAQYDGII